MEYIYCPHRSDAEFICSTDNSLMCSECASSLHKKHKIDSFIDQLKSSAETKDTDFASIQRMMLPLSSFDLRLEMEAEEQVQRLCSSLHKKFTKDLIGLKKTLLRAFRPLRACTEILEKPISESIQNLISQLEAAYEKKKPTADDYIDFKKTSQELSLIKGKIKSIMEVFEAETYQLDISSKSIKQSAQAMIFDESELLQKENEEKVARISTKLNELAKASGIMELSGRATIPQVKLLSSEESSIEEEKTPVRDMRLINMHSKNPSISSRIENKVIVKEEEVKLYDKITTVDFKKLRCKRTIPTSSVNIRAIVLLPDDRIAFTHNTDEKDEYLECSVDIMNLNTGITERRMLGHTQTIKTLVVLSDGRLASGSCDSDIRVWDTTTGTCEIQMTDKAGDVNSLLVIDDNTIASASVGKTIKLWRVTKGIIEGKLISTLNGHSHSVESLALLSNKRLVSGSGDKTVKVWDIEKHQCITTLRGHKNRINAVVVIDGDTIISGSCDRRIRVWKVSMKACITKLKDHKLSVSSIIKLDSGHIATASEDNTIKIWDPSKDKCIKDLTQYTDSVLCLVPLSGGFISGSKDKKLRIWSWEEDQL